MDLDSDSDSDNRAATSAEAVSTSEPSSFHITKRERLQKAKEASYASYIASLQNVEGLASGWISATRAVKPRTNGRFRRPDEEPPIAGYSWNNQYGVWVPSVRLVQETSFMSKISSKKAARTSISRRKTPPSTTTVQATAVRSRPFLNWTTTNETQDPSTITSSAVMDKKPVNREARVEYETNSVAEIDIEPPLARASRKRSAYQTNNSAEQPPPRSNKRERKSIKSNLEIDYTVEESSDDDVPVNMSKQETVDLDTSPTSVNVEQKARSRKKVTNDVVYLDENKLHPNSMWQEPYADDLTLYERHRTARPVSKGTILFHMDAIRPEIRCAICLDILQNTRIVRECLHRFCESCIEQALTFQNVEAVGGRRKECPICRVYIPSRRSLAPDTYMDTLIARLLDNLIWEEDNDPTIYLRSPQKSKQGLILQPPLTDVNANNSVEHEITAGRDLIANEEIVIIDNVSSMQLEARDNSSEEKVPVNRQAVVVIPELIKVVLIQQSDPKTKKKSLDDLRQPYLTLASDAPGSVVKAFICRKHGYLDTTSIDVGRTPRHIHDKTMVSKDPKAQLLLWTMYRMEPYLINDNDTLRFLNLNRTDPFKGQYMPIYYRYTG